MLRFLVVPAACLSLCGAASAQDMPGLATLSPPDPSAPAAVGAAGPDGAAAARPGGDADRTAAGTEPGRAPLGSLALRSAEPDPTRTTASLKPPPAAPNKPWCAQDRRVGTGSGFCLVN
jgi:hypothetical protein